MNALLTSYLAVQGTLLGTQFSLPFSDQLLGVRTHDGVLQLLQHPEFGGRVAARNARERRVRHSPSMKRFVWNWFGS